MSSLRVCSIDSLRVDDPQSPASDGLEVLLADRALKPASVVDHGYQQPILVQVGFQRDLAVAVLHGVRDEFADQQRCGAEIFFFGVPDRATQ